MSGGCLQSEQDPAATEHLRHRALHSQKNSSQAEKMTVMAYSHYVDSEIEACRTHLEILQLHQETATRLKAKFGIQPEDQIESRSTGTGSLKIRIPGGKSRRLGKIISFVYIKYFKLTTRSPFSRGHQRRSYGFPARRASDMAPAGSAGGQWITGVQWIAGG